MSHDVLIEHTRPNDAHELGASQTSQAAIIYMEHMRCGQHGSYSQMYTYLARLVPQPFLSILTDWVTRIVRFICMGADGSRV